MTQFIGSVSMASSARPDESSHYKRKRADSKCPKPSGLSRPLGFVVDSVSPDRSPLSKRLICYLTVPSSPCGGSSESPTSLAVGQPRVVVWLRSPSGGDARNRMHPACQSAFLTIVNA